MDFRPQKKLGFGMMRLPLNDKSDSGNVNVDLVCQMVDTFIERGFTYFDTAWMYNALNPNVSSRKL